MSNPELRSFFEFITERQNIYKRRFIDEEPFPWTDDDVMRVYHFCNVYRELDRGTRLVRNRILSQEDDRDVFFNTIVYRLVNRPKTFDIIGGFTPVDEFDADWVVRQLHVYAQDNKIFSPAYRISANRFADSDWKIDNVFYGIIRDDLLEYLPEYWMGVVHADSMEIVHKVLTQIRGIGDFIAYEIVTDLNYELLPFSENDFVNVGPGAKKGIEIIWGDVRHYETKIEYLVENQEALFDQFDLDFFYCNGEHEKRLTLRDMEHSLCEFAKWWRVTHEDGSTRRYELSDHPDQEKMDEFT